MTSDEANEGQKSSRKFLYYINPRTSFWTRIVFIVALLSIPPSYVFRCVGSDWFEKIFGSGIYFTGCLGLLSFLLKNYWDGNRKRFNALCTLESELLLQVTTFQDNLDKMEVLIKRNIPTLATPSFVEPDLTILHDIGRIEIKNDALNLLSRVADLKASMDFHSRTSLEHVAALRDPEVFKMAMERFKTQKQCIGKFRDELKELDIRVKFFIRNDRPFWAIPLPYFSKKKYAFFVKNEPENIRKYLENKNKDRVDPAYL